MGVGNDRTITRRVCTRGPRWRCFAGRGRAIAARFIRELAIPREHSNQSEVLVKTELTRSTTGQLELLIVLRHEKHPKGWIGVRLLGCSSSLADPFHRFSPARAGNTATCRPASRSWAVQPRPCGEHEVAEVCAFVHAGSAPPVRGTPGRHDLEPGDARFSPARAGNTRKAARCSSSHSVQPRPCGEHVGRRIAATWCRGSAPPVRGTLVDEDVRVICGRFSPARAGNTIRTWGL